MDQHAWDLLYNVHALRATHLEVELFARFLEEYYDPDDLLFFLYVRSVVQKVREDRYLIIISKLKKKK